MSERHPQVLIDDIIESLDRIFAYTEGMTQSDFTNNQLVVDAVLRNFEIIGEAASKLPKEFVERHQNIEWKRIIGMRNRLIHGYFGVSLPLVWQTIRHDLPTLKTKLSGRID